MSPSRSLAHRRNLKAVGLLSNRGFSPPPHHMAATRAESSSLMSLSMLMAVGSHMIRGLHLLDSRIIGMSTASHRPPQDFSSLLETLRMCGTVLLVHSNRTSICCSGESEPNLTHLHSFRLVAPSNAALSPSKASLDSTSDHGRRPYVPLPPIPQPCQPS